MPSGHEGPSKDENLLFWHERMVCAMRAARGRNVNGQPKTVSELSVSACGPTENESPAVLMPRTCWDEICQPIQTISTCAGLDIKIVERYLDPPGVIYIEFSRKEK